MGLGRIRTNPLKSVSLDTSNPAILASLLSKTRSRRGRFAVSNPLSNQTTPLNCGSTSGVRLKTAGASQKGRRLAHHIGCIRTFWHRPRQLLKARVRERLRKLRAGIQGVVATGSVRACRSRAYHGLKLSAAANVPLRQVDFGQVGIFELWSAGQGVGRGAREGSAFDRVPPR